jgi:mannan endo-1,4-beta-mannosidase
MNISNPWIGGVSNDFGTGWITNHAAACAAAGKPCVLEEYGVSSNHVAVESVWQSTSFSSNGMGGDMFWDYGDVLSTGKTSDDGNTIFYGTSDWTGLVTNHVVAINGGSSPPPPASSTTSTAVPSKTTSASSSASASPTSGGTVPHWGQCGGQGWTGPTGCVSPYQCVYPQPVNIWYKQCCVSASSC